MGNGYAQSALQALQLNDREKDRVNNKEIAQIQADAQVKSAEATSGATKYSADTQKMIADGRLKLDYDVYRNVTLPMTAQAIGKTKAETQKILNEVVTSEKEFVLYMKKLSMGVDNMIVEYFQTHEGFDITKPETYPKDKDKRRWLLSQMVALNASLGKNIETIQALFGVVNGQNRNPRPPLLGNANSDNESIIDLPFFKLYKNRKE